jgi:hypothetical protein
MNTSMTVRPAQLLEQMSPAARTRFPTDTSWAAACGLPKETLSRLRRNPSCDLRTLGALAKAAGCTLVAVPHATPSGAQMPESLDRDYEDALLDLCAARQLDANVWRAHGPSFFMGGLAVLLAGARGFDRERHLRLAETLHPGVSTPEVFGMWLKRSPISSSRFLPMARKRAGLA